MRDAIVSGPGASRFDKDPAASRTKRAPPKSHSTNGAGGENHHAPSRPGMNARSDASGQGTRPAHAATAHAASESAMPKAGGIDSPRELDHSETQHHPAGPLPAGGAQKAPHRFVLGGGGRGLARVGHQHGRLRERVRQSPAAAATAVARWVSREQCDLGQRGRGGMPVERGAEEQERIGARHVPERRLGG
jgi:hypothetical protein